MKLILHNALKDLRAQRWLVAPWAIVLAALGAAEIFAPEALLVDAYGSGTATPPYTWLLLGLATCRLLLTWLIAVRVVHADPLDNSEAFWLTRPLSAPMLLAAKAGLLAVLLVVLPSAVAAVVFFHAGFPMAGVPLLVARWQLPELVLLLPVVFVASLTRDIARNLIVAFVALAVWHPFQSYSAQMSLAAPFSALAPPVDSVYRAWAWTLVVFAGAVIALIAGHYLSRRRRNVAIAAVAVAAGCAGLAWAWPVRAMIAESNRLRSDTPWLKAWTGADGVRVEVVPGSVRVATRSSAFAMDQMVADLRVSGLGAGIVVNNQGGGRAELAFPGLGETVRQDDVGFRGFETFPGVAQIEENRRAVERIVGARVLGDATLARSVGWNGLALVRLSRPEYERYQRETGRLDATLTLVARRAAVAAAVPLRKGASARIGDIVFSIADIRDLARRLPSGRVSRNFVVDLQLSAPRTLSTASFGRIGFLLRNRRRGEAEPLESGVRYRVPTGTGAIATFCVRRSQLGAAHVLGEGRETVPGESIWHDEGWLADAELVFLSFEVLGTFTRQVSIPDFRLPELYN
jgi:hypothetical protein